MGSGVLERNFKIKQVDSSHCSICVNAGLGHGGEIDRFASRSDSADK